jgi:hypothetical protein
VADEVVTPTLDARKLRVDFPIFEQRMHGKALAQPDSAASAQKPKVRATELPPAAVTRQGEGPPEGGPSTGTGAG